MKRCISIALSLWKASANYDSYAKHVVYIALSLIWISNNSVHSMRKEASQAKRWSFPLERHNVILLAIGVAIIIVAYILMLTANTSDPVQHQQLWNNPLAVTVAPILLVLGYAVIIPIAILYRPKKSHQG
jgi:heme/copper-type cytochrome/quinol oxidase subunit 2